MNTLRNKYTMDIHCEISETPTDLCSLIQTHGSDKGGIGHCRHQYTRYYSPLFTPIRNKSLTMFEMGVGTFHDIAYGMGPNYSPGSSLRAWAEYFPHAKIYSADIDKTILFQTERIKTTYCNQKQWESIQSMWEEEFVRNVTFDIIIDDGCHDMDANNYLFENSIHKLNPGGVYIIEDVNLNDESYWIQRTDYWSKKHGLDGRVVKIPNPHFPPYDLLIVFYKHD